MSKGTIMSNSGEGLYSVSMDRKDGSPVVASAWCADLTEDLSGNVGVIEIAGDAGKGFNILPGHEGNAVYDAARDGEMKRIQKFPNTSPTGEVYWNWAMRAGWQKWKPNYRYGEISNIDPDADTCTVALDPCYATDAPDGAQLDINQTSSLSGVAIEYMDCNAMAFEDGDRVIVAFENNDWSSPRVIGFESEPKSCFWEPWDGPKINSLHEWSSQTGIGTAVVVDGALVLSELGIGINFVLYPEDRPFYPDNFSSEATIKWKINSITGSASITLFDNDLNYVTIFISAVGEFEAEISNLTWAPDPYVGGLRSIALGSLSSATWDYVTFTR
jgi:hypothetical protein